MFFPRDGMGLLAAQEICAECPVSKRCLEYALENHVDHGIWGGCSERERRRILRWRRDRQTVRYLDGIESPLSRDDFVEETRSKLDETIRQDRVDAAPDEDVGGLCANLRGNSMRKDF
jgi:hypothetical protein